MLPKCLPTQARRQVIQDNILTKTYDELATMCHCSKMTIVRTVNDWRQEGGFEQLLFDEFFKLYPKVAKVYPDKALDKLVFLISKGITRRAEITTDSIISEKKEVNYNINVSADEGLLLDALARKYIKSTHQDEPSSIH